MDLLRFNCSTFIWRTCRSACYFKQRGRNRPCQCVKEESSHLKPLWVCGVNIWNYKYLFKVRMTNIALVFFETVSEFYFDNDSDLIDKNSIPYHTQGSFCNRYFSTISFFRSFDAFDFRFQVNQRRFTMNFQTLWNARIPR